jgi:hypothetical protein
MVRVWTARWIAPRIIDGRVLTAEAQLAANLTDEWCSTSLTPSTSTAYAGRI